MRTGAAIAVTLTTLAVLAACEGDEASRRSKPLYGYSAGPDKVGDDAGGGQDALPGDDGTPGGDVVVGPDVPDGAGGPDAAEGPDGQVTGDAATSTDAGGKPDGGSVTPSDGKVGSACKLEADCKDTDGVCLDWPGGYCTVLECLQGGGGCPGGSECHPVDEGITGCLKTCATQSDCRAGYDCKRLIRQDGTFSQVCFSTAPGAGGPAAICSQAKDCAGQATCLTFLPKGYCAVVGCGEGIPCPSKTKCVSLGQINACLADCDGAHPCPGSAAKIQSCMEETDIQGQPVTVCMTGEAGKDIGEFCTTDLECSSKHCTIHATGRCAPGEQLCSSDKDCGATGGTCDIKGEYLVGSCGQACSLDVPCPEGATCIPTSATAGECSLTCKSLADVFTCDENLGEVCVIGDPLGPAPSEDTYACFSQPPGQVGAHCDTAPGGPGCATDLMCYQGKASAGYCTTGCGAKDYCPWTTICGSAGAFEQCLRRCKAKTDCPDGFDCAAKPVVTGVPQKVCFPL
ncbi:MAG: hypothetical protein AMXMBFR64_14800 [Myxococcales bacterium]